jgi:hypothetical protein
MATKTEEYLLETADRCTSLARRGRELIEQLESLGNELMAKAVELDTERDKDENGGRNASAVSSD